jgi:hypothetical protein
VLRSCPWASGTHICELVAGRATRGPGAARARNAQKIPCTTGDLRHGGAGARSSPSRALVSASELLAPSNDCGHGELDRVVTGMRADRLEHRASRFRRLRSQQRDPRHPSFRRLLEVCVGRRHPPNDWRRVPALVRRGPRSGGADGQRHKAAALLLRHSEAARRRLRKRGGDQVTVSLIGGEDWSVARPIGGPDPKDGSLCLTIGVIVRPWA